MAAAANLARVKLDLQRAESSLKESEEKAANAAKVSSRIIRSLRVLRESDATSAHLSLKSELVAAKESNLGLKTELANTKKDLTYHTSLLHLTRQQLHKRVGEKDALLQDSRAELAGTQAVLLQTTHKVTYSPYLSSLTWQVTELEAALDTQLNLATAHSAEAEQLRLSYARLANLQELSRTELDSATETSKHLAAELAEHRASLQVSIAVREDQAVQLSLLRGQVAELSHTAALPLMATSETQTDPFFSFVPDSELVRLKVRASSAELEKNKSAALELQIRSAQR